MFLLKKTSLLRVESGNSPYSLAQSQLAFWTVIIAISVIYIWITTKNLPELTPSILGLLGISVATATGSKLVGDSLRNNQERVAIPKDSDGFFNDIVSDNISPNIQRFQMIIWTIILGFIFLINLLSDRQLYDFPDSYLFLTGISSGTYVLLKYSEDKKQIPQKEEEKKPEEKPEATK
jgi:F0F1-type ATP synthase membrane subunit a